MQANLCDVKPEVDQRAAGGRPIDAALVEFRPGAVRYIKLGPGGQWARQAIAEGTVPFGYREISHDICSARNWEQVRTGLTSMGRSRSGVGQGLREIWDFYELPADTLWVTIADGHLCWTFAAEQVEIAAADVCEGPARVRRTIGGWRRDNLLGEPLTTASLSSALTRTANYRMTICAVQREDYLIRRIRGVDAPVHAKARSLLEQMQDVALHMIRELHWEEFETLVDLIFARDGWRRASVVGKDQADVDLILDHSTTGEQAWVQVKSKAGQAEVDDYLDRFRHNGSCDRFYFVCHSPMGKLGLPDEPRLHLWSGPDLAANAVAAGLFDWLMQRTR